MENIDYFDQFLQEFANSLQIADSRKPQKTSNRGTVYQNGIGSFTEDETVDLVLAEFPNNWENCQFHRSVSYPHNKRSKCDLLISTPDYDLYVEIKLMRILGNNAKLNDNITMHILSPYPKHRSALTDVSKLNNSGFEGKKAIAIFGYDPDDYPMIEMMHCFEKLAEDSLIKPPIIYDFTGLVHPVHQQGKIYGWLLK